MMREEDEETSARNVQLPESKYVKKEEAVCVEAITIPGFNALPLL